MQCTMYNRCRWAAGTSERWPEQHAHCWRLAVYWRGTQTVRSTRTRRASVVGQLARSCRSRHRRLFTIRVTESANEHDRHLYGDIGHLLFTVDICCCLCGLSSSGCYRQCCLIHRLPSPQDLLISCVTVFCLSHCLIRSPIFGLIISIEVGTKLAF